MNPATRRSHPYWTYLDLLILAGLIGPCLIGSQVVTLLAASLLPSLAAAKVWIAMLFFYALWFGSLYLVMKARYFDEPFDEALGWVMPRSGLELVSAIASGPLLAILLGLIGAVLKTPLVDIPMKKLLEGQLSLALFGIFSVILGPVTEELAFRGFLMPLLVRDFGWFFGILLTSIPFALLHGAQYGWHWQYIVLVGLAGAVFGAARLLTGSTLASSAMHSSYNLTFYAAYVFGGASL